MKNLLFLTAISFSINCFSQGLIVNGWKYNSTAPTYGEIRIDFRASGTSSATNWNTLAGNPHSSVLTISNMVDATGASTGVSISTVAPGNWSNTGGTTANNSVQGITGGTAFSSSGATNAVYQSIHYNYGTIAPARYDATKWQYELNGLDPSTTYSIKIAGNEGTYGFTCTTMVFQAAGATTVSQTLNGGPGGGGGATSVTTSITLTLKPDATGKIKVWMNTGTGDMALNCGWTINH